MQTGSTPAAGLDLWNYVQVARRRWKVVLLMGFLVPAVSILISLRQEPRFAASSEVLVKRQNLAATLTPGQAPYTDAQSAVRAIETQIQLARVPDLADQVIDAAGMGGQLSTADFLGSSTVKAKANSDILVFTVEWPASSVARTLAGSYADEFSKYRRQLDTTELDALSTSVRSQLAALDSSGGQVSSLSNDLQDKLRQIQTLQALQTSNAIVVRRPDAVVTVGPTMTTMAVGGLLLGLLLAAGLAFLLESIDTRVRKSSEVAEILGVPLLARIPDPPARLRKRSALVVTEEPDSLPAEAFAFLRTNLTFALADSGSKVIMFCSAVEQEGKSTTISNLAVALARSGSRVVLVDLDYRRPTIHSFFDISRSPGVTEVAAGTTDLKIGLRDVRIAHPGVAGRAAADGTDQPLLRVLPAGGVTHQIDVDSVIGVLERLRARADIVLVDAPPLLLVGEALALSARMDALVVVARLDHVRRPVLEEFRRAFEAAPVRPLGFVATAADEEPGYSHYYRKAYGYAPDDESPPVVDAPEPATVASPWSTPGPNGVPDRSQSPVRAPTLMPESVPVPASVGPELRETLLDIVFANRGRPGAAETQPDESPIANVGVRPRRSWVQDDRRVVPTPPQGHPDEAGTPLDSPPSSPQNGTEDPQQG